MLNVAVKEAIWGIQKSFTTIMIERENDHNHVLLKLQAELDEMKNGNCTQVQPCERVR